MDNSLPVERAILLGLVTLLGATTTLFSALAALVLSAAAAFMVFLVTPLIRRLTALPAAAGWALAAAVGFSVSWTGAAIVPFLVPIPPASLLYLQLAGLTPIVFVGIAPTVSGRTMLRYWLLFVVLSVGIGTVREILGRGTIFGRLLFGSFSIPADFVAAPAGALLIVGGLVLAGRLIHRKTFRGVA